MKQNNLHSFGGLCAILTGVFTALAGLLYFLLPAQQRLGVPGAQILPSFAQNSSLLTLENLALGLVGIFGMGIVPALTRLLQAEEDGWLRWTSNLASLGFAVSAVGSFIILGRLPVIAAAFVAGDASTQAALAAVWRTTLDPFGLWGFGAVGLWILAVSLTAWRFRAVRGGVGSLPINLAYLGVLAAILHWIVPVAFVSHAPALFFIVAGGGLAVIATWYVWMGVHLLK